jgi:hypothetical protein
MERLGEMMSEVIFDENGLQVIKFCGRYRTDKESRTRFEIIRKHDQADYLGSRKMTLSLEQMKSLLNSGIITEE